MTNDNRAEVNPRALSNDIQLYIELDLVFLALMRTTSFYYSSVTILTHVKPFSLFFITTITIIKYVLRTPQ